jgi:hypothetical protein
MLEKGLEASRQEKCNRFERRWCQKSARKQAPTLARLLAGKAAGAIRKGKQRLSAMKGGPHYFKSEIRDLKFSNVKFEISVALRAESLLRLPSQNNQQGIVANTEDIGSEFGPCRLFRLTFGLSCDRRRDIGGTKM